MGSCDRGVECHGVGDDGHRHAGGLLAILLVQDLRHRLETPGEVRQRILAQDPRGVLDSALKDGETLLDLAFRQRQAFDRVGQIVHSAADPTVPRPRLEPALTHGSPRLRRRAIIGVQIQRESPPAKLGGLDTLAESRLFLAQVRRQLDREGQLDRIVGLVESLAEALPSLPQHGSGWSEFGFKHDRRAALLVHDDIGPQGGLLEDAVLLGANPPAPERVPALQRPGQLVVDGRFVRLRHEPARYDSLTQ